jgi:threonine dehydrogenase-like Zn-dependent dehydrogenase
MTKDPAQNIDRLRAASPTGDGYDVVVEATGTTAVGNICVPLTRNGGTVLVYGVTGQMSGSRSARSSSSAERSRSRARTRR